MRPSFFWRRARMRRRPKEGRGTRNRTPYAAQWSNHGRRMFTSRLDIVAHRPCLSPRGLQTEWLGGLAGRPEALGGLTFGVHSGSNVSLALSQGFFGVFVVA